MGERKRIGILTGGGDCPGLNAVIRAVTKTAIFDHGMEVLGILDGYGGLLRRSVRPLAANDTSGILALGGTILGASNRDNPFKVAVKVNGEVRHEDRSGVAVQTCRDLGLDALVCVGGDGTMNIAHGLLEKGVPVVGVPKTIDNDLEGTDRTFGFDSAVSIVADAIDRLHTTAQSHHRVMIVETMGRYAGWLALCGGMAGGGDVLLIPEIPYRIERICDSLNNRAVYGKRFSIVVIAEGAKPVGGELFVQEVDKVRTDPIRLGGVGHRLAARIEDHSGLECRVTVLGHLQRGGSPTAFDRILATRYGAKAVELVAQGRFGEMASLRGEEITSVPIADAVKALRLVSRDSELVRTARSVGTSFGD